MSNLSGVRTISYELADTAGGAPWYARRLHLEPMVGGPTGGGRYRRLDYLEVISIVDGVGQLVSYPEHGRPRSTALVPGQMWLLRPIDEPLIRPTGPDGMTIFFVSFLVDDWRKFASFVGVDSAWMTTPDPPMTTFDPEDPAALVPFERALERFQNQPAPIDLLEFWLAVIPRLLPTRPRGRTHGMPVWLVRSLDEMRDEENLRGGLPRFLDLARVSGAHLSTTTKRHLGKTPTAIVQDLRIRHAATLLSSTSEDIGTIAQRCGFSSLSYFSRSFARAYHVSPSEHRVRSTSGFIYGYFHNRSGS